MQLFYNPNISEDTKYVTFTKEESRHIVKVLRMKEGAIFRITDGNGAFYVAKITGENPKGCKAEILTKEIQQPLPYQLHLAVAPTKLNDRYEWFLEKATEIGIAEITPILCDRSERKTIKAERYEKILQSAMKQSLQPYLPVLNPVVPFSDFLDSKNTGNSSRFIAHCDETDKNSLKQLLRPNENVVILIGPEGDFSPSEIELAIKSGYRPVSMGESRLRTETAAIVACHSVAFVNQN